MSEGSSPWGAPVVPAAKQDRDDVAAGGFAAAPESRLPHFPVDRAEGLIYGVSRLAGVLAFLVALIAAGWFLAKLVF